MSGNEKQTEAALQDEAHDALQVAREAEQSGDVDEMDAAADRLIGIMEDMERLYGEHDGKITALEQRLMALETVRANTTESKTEPSASAAEERRATPQRTGGTGAASGAADNRDKPPSASHWYFRSVGRKRH